MINLKITWRKKKITPIQSQSLPQPKVHRKNYPPPQHTPYPTQRSATLHILWHSIKGFKNCWYMPMYLQLTGHRSSLMIHWTPVQFLVKPHIHPSFPWPLHVYIKHYMYILPVDINLRLKIMGIEYHTVIQLLIKCKKISPSVHADLLEPLSCNTEEHWYLQANLSVYLQKSVKNVAIF